FHKRTDFNLEEIVRPAVFVPKSKRLDTLLKEFRVNRNHMAIVVDEYGGAAGLITIEDIIEQIVGEIEDEFDIDEDAYIKKHSEQEYVIKALTPIEEFNEYFHTKFSDEEFDTVGGLVTKNFGRLPKSGESIQMDKYQFTVLRADKRRIHLLKMTL
ncbi:MAG: CBS domain-containing protein, partial [Proteobacteria bacterium]|nr:CBS domain-containing protein [Pseudomonadota bacterium]